MFQQMTSAIKRLFSRQAPITVQPSDLDQVDEHERQLAVYNARMTHRDYVIENRDKSQQQLDQLVFYVGSAAFGICITQSASVSTWLEVICLFLSTVSSFLSIVVTYLSIKSSTQAFDSHFDDLEEDESFPYAVSETTKKIELDLSWYNKAQLVIFSASMLFLLFFIAARLVKQIFPMLWPIS